VVLYVEVVVVVKDILAASLAADNALATGLYCLHTPTPGNLGAPSTWGPAKTWQRATERDGPRDQGQPSNSVAQ
jgi:hypothetical protein